MSLTLAAATLAAAPACAESMSGALALAYSNNPDINSQRAAVRAADENVPAAKAGWLPKVTAQGSLGYQVNNVGNAFGQAGTNQKLAALPLTGQATVTQNVFDGMVTYHSIDKAESAVLAAR